MEDWKEEFHKRFVQHYYEDDIYNFYGYGDDAPQMGSGKEEVDKVIDFIEQELSKAREEGRREVYEAIVFDKNIPHDITTFVAANLWKNMRDKAKEELSKLNSKKNE